MVPRSRELDAQIPADFAPTRVSAKRVFPGEAESMKSCKTKRIGSIWKCTQPTRLLKPRPGDVTDDSHDASLGLPGHPADDVGTHDATRAVRPCATHQCCPERVERLSQVLG